MACSLCGVEKHEKTSTCGRMHYCEECGYYRSDGHTAACSRRPKKEIWKFTLEPGKPLQMPYDARVLSVGAQGDQITLWALVSPTRGREERLFIAVPTGVEVDNLTLGRFVGTVQMQVQGVHLVFHVFEASDGDGSVVLDWP